MCVIYVNCVKRLWVPGSFIIIYGVLSGIVITCEGHCPFFVIIIIIIFSVSIIEFEKNILSNSSTRLIYKWYVQYPTLQSLIFHYICSVQNNLLTTNALQLEYIPRSLLISLGCWQGFGSA